MYLLLTLYLRHLQHKFHYYLQDYTDKSEVDSDDETALNVTRQATLHQRGADTFIYQLVIPPVLPASHVYLSCIYHVAHDIHTDAIARVYHSLLKQQFCTRFSTQFFMKKNLLYRVVKKGNKINFKKLKEGYAGTRDLLKEVGGYIYYMY